MPAAGLDQVLAFFYRPQGRIGRVEFALGVVLVYTLGLAILFFFLARFDPESGAVAFVIVASLPLSVGMLIIVAKRCHDIGLPGTFLLLLFVPIVGIVWLIALCFIPGTAGPNAYGPAPQFLPD
jgi:uncharacterized membrane protein YhaH (DUF805 family)